MLLPKMNSGGTAAVENVSMKNHPATENEPPISKDPKSMCCPEAGPASETAVLVNVFGLSERGTSVAPFLYMLGGKMYVQPPVDSTQSRSVKPT